MMEMSEKESVNMTIEWNYPTEEQRRKKLKRGWEICRMISKPLIFISLKSLREKSAIKVQEKSILKKLWLKTSKFGERYKLTD